MNGGGGNWAVAGSGRAASVRIGINGWLISFGDLLTLLLCTFVAIISFAGIRNNPEIRANSSESSQKAEIKPRLPLTGTQVAKLYPEAPDKTGYELWLKASDLEFMENGASGQLREQLQLALRTMSELEEVKIEACAMEQAQGREQAWFSSMGMALRVSAFLRELGLPPGKLSLRAVGGGCGLLQGNPEPNEAKVKLSFVEKVSLKRSN